MREQYELGADSQCTPRAVGATDVSQGLPAGADIFARHTEIPRTSTFSFLLQAGTLQEMRRGWWFFQLSRLTGRKGVSGARVSFGASRSEFEQKLS